jgi:hypothetical protein
MLPDVSDSGIARIREGRYVMEQILCEPVELTEFELDEVAGGNPFGSFTGNTSNSGSFSNILNANGTASQVAFVEFANSTVTLNGTNPELVS